MASDCTVYRCARQAETYLYVRDDVAVDTLPPALLQHLGALQQVMTLDLAQRSQLARADIDTVKQRLLEQGYYLQLPPEGRVDAHLHRGD